MDNITTPKPKRDRSKYQKFFEKPSKTKQSFREESNVNNIMERYRNTGTVPVTNRTGMYQDNEAMDYKQCMDRIANAQTEFENLPAKVREKFDNEPYNMLEFLSNEDNREEAIILGLINPVNADLAPVPAPTADPPRESDSPPKEDVSKGD